MTVQLPVESLLESLLEPSQQAMLMSHCGRTPLAAERAQRAWDLRRERWGIGYYVQHSGKPTLLSVRKPMPLPGALRVQTTRAAQHLKGKQILRRCWASSSPLADQRH